MSKIKNYTLEEKLNGNIKLYVYFGPQLADIFSEEERHIVLTILENACGKLSNKNASIEQVSSFNNPDELADYLNPNLEFCEGDVLDSVNRLVEKGIIEMEGRILCFNVRNLYKYLEKQIGRISDN